MKTTRNPYLSVVSVLLIGTLLFSSCGSTTVIRSNPTGAKVYLNDEFVGVTPYEHYDTKIVGTKTNVHLKMDGYEDYRTYFSRNECVDVGAVVASFFLCAVPLLWSMKYKPTHQYELTPFIGKQGVSNSQTAVEKPTSGGLTDEKVAKLTQLKALMDQKILTQEEFDAQKKKLLEE